MELVPQKAEEAAAPLMASDVPRSDVPHPHDAAEQPLPVHAKLLLGVAAPFLLILAVARVVLIVVLSILLVVVCKTFRCRCIIQPTVSVLGRLFLFAFGVWPGLLRLRKPAKPEPAPIIVLAPHVGGLEAFLMMYDGMPRAIAMATYANLPVVSSIFKASGGLAVPVPAANDDVRKTKQQQKSAKVAPADQLKAPTQGEAAPPPGAMADTNGGQPAEKPSTQAVRKAIAAHKQAFNPSDPANAVPLFILPEGTTHSGRTLIKFFSGGFEGGGPVQPVLVSYPYTYFHAAYFGGGMGEHAMRLLINPWQRIEVTYLPVYHPSAEEQTNADLYAENVRLTMAKAAGLPPSEYGAKALRKEYLAAKAGTTNGR